MDKPFHLADREPVKLAIEAAAKCETLDELYAEIAAYRGTDASHTVPFARPYPTAIANPIMIVSEKPEERDAELQKPFTGEWGRVMENTMRRFNVELDQVHVTYACHYPPSQTDRPNATHLSASRPFLFREIEIVRPRAIIAQGAVVLDSLFGYRDKITPLLGHTMLWRHGGFSTQAFVMWHPAFAARFKASIPAFEDQFREALIRLGMPNGDEFVPQTHDRWWREALAA